MLDFNAKYRNPKDKIANNKNKRTNGFYILYLFIKYGIAPYAINPPTKGNETVY